MREGKPKVKIESRPSGGMTRTIDAANFANGNFNPGCCLLESSSSFDHLRPLSESFAEGACFRRGIKKLLIRDPPLGLPR